MLNLFKEDYSVYKNKVDDIKALTSTILKDGQLSLITGAGVSVPLGLPKWITLVRRLCESSQKDEIRNLVAGKDDSDLNLKLISEKFKDSFNDNNEYLEEIQRILYDKIELNLDTVHKPMMTALSSLFVGNYKGRVKRVVTYNFDNLLNWYLSVLGLSVNTEYDNQAIDSNEDCNIFHVHGILPHPSSFSKVKKSKSIVFSQDEFEDNIRDRTGIRILKIRELLTRGCFLAVGVSYTTLLNDIKPEINVLKNKLYLNKSDDEFQRKLPFGITIQATERGGKEKLLNEDDENSLLKLGIITLKCKDYEIPQLIFEIVQNSRFNN